MDVLLIDGKNWMFRNLYTRVNLRSSKGFPTGALYGMVVSLLRLARHFPETAIVFCWDGEDKQYSWRHHLDVLYKANRKKGGPLPQSIKDFNRQMPVVKEFLGKMGYAQFEVLSLEADDLIGILATYLKTKVERVVVYSSDFDMTQLMSDNVVVVRDMDKTIQCRQITIKELKAQKGFTPKGFLKYRALLGDPGDGIPRAIPGVGPVKAKKLMKEGLDPTLDECPMPEYKKYWKRIKLNYRLSRIVRKADSKELSKKTREALVPIIKKARKPENLFRNVKSFKTKENYKEMLEFFREYELDQALEASIDFWNIK